VWVCTEIMVQLNTPGVRDGRVAVWQDGSLIADWSTQQNDQWYDNLVLATSYIGPISTGAPPKPPTNVRIVS